jgi:hypothetical protein
VDDKFNWQLPTGITVTAQPGGNISSNYVFSTNQQATLAAIASALAGTLTVGGSVAVSNLPSTQPISAASLPLPTGAATSANQPALNADGGALAHVTNFPASQAVSWSGQSVGVSSLPSLPSGSNTIGSVNVANFPSTQAVSASSLPLPTGAATAAGVAAVATALGTPAQDGTDATGVTAPTGGVGIRGWLSGNYSKLTAIATALAGTLTTVNAAGSSIIGKVGIDQTTPGTTNATYDKSYASGLAVVCQITVPTSGNASALSINTLLAAANTANSALCPVAAVPASATMAYIQVPSSGQQVNISYSATSLPTIGATGYGAWIPAGATWPVTGQLSLQALELISSASQIVSIEFRN